MKAHLILVGKTTNAQISQLVDDYVARLKHYVGFGITVLPELKNTKGLTVEQQKQLEGESIVKALRTGDVVVVLDERGREMRSVELADWMRKRMNTVARRLVFVVGGPYGFSPEVYARADEKLSLSRLTFSHQMVRLFFVEQLYRVMTILNGEPYHHE